jgi:hypothetical protein
MLSFWKHGFKSLENSLMHKRAVAVGRVPRKHKPSGSLFSLSGVKL